MGEIGPDPKSRKFVAHLRSGAFLVSLLKIVFSFEFFFVVFLFAGVFKENPRLAWVPLDLTLIGLVFSLIFALLHWYGLNWTIGKSLLRLLMISACFFLWAIISLKWSDSWGYGGRKALQLVVLGFWSFTGGALIIGGQDNRLYRFCGILVFFSVWMAAELVGLIVSGNILEEWEFASNYLGFGRLLGLSVIVLLCMLLWWPMGKVPRAIAGALSVFIISILMISGGRGPFLATLAVFVVPLIRDIKPLKYGLRIHRNLITISTLLVAVLAGFVFVGNRYFGFTTVDRIWVLMEDGGGGSTRERIWLFGKAWDLFLESPIIGHGIGNFGFLLGWGDVRAYPHNIVLEILVELGLVGLFLFIWYLAASLKGLTLARLRSDPGAALVLMLFLNAAANSLVSGDLPDNRMFFALLGLCAGRFRRPAAGMIT